MPHVSPRKLKDVVLRKMLENFFSILTAKHKTRNSQIQFFEELFTDTEKIMLAKRMGAVILLDQGYTPYQVSKGLRLSETTTNKLQLGLLAGKYKHILLANTIKDRKIVERYIENLISPLPPYGKNLLKHLEENL